MVSTMDWADRPHLLTRCKGDCLSFLEGYTVHHHPLQDTKSVTALKLRYSQVESAHHVQQSITADISGLFVAIQQAVLIPVVPKIREVRSISEGAELFGVDKIAADTVFVPFKPIVLLLSLGFTSIAGGASVEDTLKWQKSPPSLPLYTPTTPIRLGDAA